MAHSTGRAQQLGKDLFDHRRVSLAFALAHHLAHKPLQQAGLGLVGGGFLRVLGQHLAGQLAQRLIAGDLRQALGGNDLARRLAEWRRWRAEHRR